MTTTLKKNWIIGKTVKDVCITRWAPREGDSSKITDIQSIEFTDGSRVYFCAIEGDTDHYVYPGYSKKPSA